jgi:hypothetical protein
MKTISKSTKGYLRIRPKRFDVQRQVPARLVVWLKVHDYSLEIAEIPFRERSSIASELQTVAQYLRRRRVASIPNPPKICESEDKERFFTYLQKNYSPWLSLVTNKTRKVKRCISHTKRSDFIHRGITRLVHP